MAFRDDADREIAVYLRSLLDHARTCRSSSCPHCEALHCVCELVSSFLFSNDCYAEVRAAARAGHSREGVA